MRQILILVEGQTEEQFIKNILNPYLNSLDVHLTPTIINTKIVKGGSNFKGGITSYDQVKRDILRLVRSSTTAVTTFIDYYGLPNSFPGFGKVGSSIDKVLAIEKAFFDDIGANNFIPYVQIHEFEALLFSSLSGFEYNFPENKLSLKMVSDITESYPNPEDINDNPLTAPSKRLIAIYPQFRKPFHGPLIALQNEIEIVLEKCPHFSGWVQKLIIA